MKPAALLTMQPVAELPHYLRPAPAVQQGGDSEILGIPYAELTPKVRAAIGALVDEVHMLRQELEEARGQADALGRLADQDPLLPVMNRRAFVRELSRAMAAAGRSRQPGSIIYIDVNDLKRVNDAHGHAAGDAVLEMVADVLTANVRRSDCVARLGGDEFGVILSHADMAVARAKTESLAASVRGRSIPWEKTELRVSVAVGCYTFRGGEPLADMLVAADRAMYADKRGR